MKVELYELMIVMKIIFLVRNATNAIVTKMNTKQLWNALINNKVTELFLTVYFLKIC